MGCYYLTATRSTEAGLIPAGPGPTQAEPVGTLKVLRFAVTDACEQGEGMIFNCPAELFLAFQQKKVGTHARIKVRLPMEKKVFSEGKEKGKLEELNRNPTTAGTSPGWCKRRSAACCSMTS